jgi:AraC-like DNA-binding protein
MSLSELLDAAEMELGLSLTVHDLRGFFVDLEGHRLIQTHHLHRHEWCRHQRFPDSKWEKRCFECCYQEAHPKALLECGVQVVDCWKGAREMRVPLIREGVVQGLLFAGLFCGDERLMPSSTRRDVGELPGLDASKEQRLKILLELLAKGLLDRVEDLRQGGPKGSREEQIQSLLHTRSHEELTIGDVAKALGLSSSRASHVIKEEFGLSFIKLLVQVRIEKAVVLLKTPENSLAFIAQQTGFSNVYYFNTCFKKNMGQPPGEYRKDLKMHRFEH